MACWNRNGDSCTDTHTHPLPPAPLRPGHTYYTFTRPQGSCCYPARYQAIAGAAAALSVSSMLSTLTHTVATCLSHCTSCSKLSSKKMSASTCGSVYV